MKILYNAGRIANIAVCKYCKSVIEYNNDEVQYWTSSDGPGGCGGQEEYIDCPSCNRTIRLD